MSFRINNRRYTGCKQKLCDWIKETIDENCLNCSSFCDLFAGTGVVTAKMINDFDTFYVNDFLYSNEIIFKAFFLKQNFNESLLYQFYDEYKNLLPDDCEENFVSLNYSGSFFSRNDALLIGEIRNRIENSRPLLNEKEYSILLASLLFSADRSANTCGHYDAFIRKRNIKSSFKFELVEPIINSSDDTRNIYIYREDSNDLAKKLNCDVIYIDPPYSSRQYSRFYHVLEVLVKWDNPELYGTAKKPSEENMSEYCKSKALDSFKSLVYSLKCKYIVVSYNNTYNSKSSSSKNKMSLEDIENVLSKKGSVSVFKHDYKAFNAGKTEIDNHEELLFVVKVEKND